VKTIDGQSSLTMANTGQPRRPDDPPTEDHERNQYIPSFIAKKPFYVPDDSADYLEHQRIQRETDSSLATSKWYDRGAKAGPAATKFRKGACANCGAMTHSAKQCLSRPRKQGARWTGRDIAADERVQDVSLGWDAKRDRWNGYEAGEYQRVVDEFNEVEALRKERRAAEGGDGEAGEDGDDGARYEEEAKMGRTQAGSTRNLRLREDTAKYLLDLDLDSAKYDPKTRSMAGGGGGEAPAALEDDGADQGFMRKTAILDGDGAEFDRAQRYAWEAQERSGVDAAAAAAAKLHLQANPTEGEIVLKRLAREAGEKRAAQRKALLDRYGGEEHLEKPDASKVPLITESERFVEYDERGGVKGAPRVIPRSRYAEDVRVNNHAGVWGSWWDDFVWGYACCHSTIKQSYCTGADGIRALEEEKRRKAGLDVEAAEQGLLEAPPEEDEDEERDDGERDRRKRRAHEMHDGVTEEDVEEYRRKRSNFNDPMAKILD
jgi:pre-mRNA-processing factor SLU7